MLFPRRLPKHFLAGHWRELGTNVQSITRRLPFPLQQLLQRTPGNQTLRRCRAMDSPIVTQLFRQLFRHRPRGCQGHLPTTTTLRNGLSQSNRRSAAAAGSNNHHYYNGRGYATRASIDRGMKKNESRWQQRTHILPEDRSEEFAKYPYISMQELKQRTERPRKVKMLLRDFIEGMARSQSQLTVCEPHFLILVS